MDYVLRQFKFIYSEKIGDKLVEEFFEESAGATISAICDFKFENASDSAHDPLILKENASFGAKVTHALSSIDAHFESGLFRKIEPSIAEDKILTKATTSLPSILMSG